MSDELREKIVEIVYSGRFYKPTKKVINIIADQILDLFDISKVEVEVKGKITNEHENVKVTNAILTRPATFDDLKKGGILKVNE